MSEQVIKLSAVLSALPNKTTISGTEKLVVSDSGTNKAVTIGDLKAPLETRLTNIENNLVVKQLGIFSSYDDAHNAAAQQAINARKYPVIGYSVQSATSMIVIQVVETTTKVVQYLWAGTNLYYRHITLNSAGSQVTNTGAWTQHFIYSLDELSKTNQTKATANANRVYINALQENIKELGNYASEDEALEAIKNPSISGNKNIITGHLTYQNAYSITFVQCIENDYCRQVIVNKCKFFQRAIYFTSGNRTAINYCEDWSCLFPDRLVWSTDSNKYLPSQFGLTFNKDNTDAIPLATTSNDGLMSKNLVAKISELETKINKLLN